MAVSADGTRWIILNASPDLRQQIEATPELWPAAASDDAAPRASPIRAVVLTSGDVDHIAGLLHLREGHRFGLHAPPRVLDALSGSPIFNVLDPSLVTRVPLVPHQTVEIAGLAIAAFPVAGKVALYRESDVAYPPGLSVSGDVVGLTVRSSPRSYFHYVPGCAEVTKDLRERLAAAPLVLFDGTLWSDDEMIVQGLSTKSGRRMGHVSLSGPGGSIAGLADLGIGSKVFVHINNSNPVLRPDSAERQAAERVGWEIAFDGMEMRL